jgi:hypothetical protein
VRKRQVAAFNRADRERRNAYTKRHYDKNKEAILERRKTESWRAENAARLRRRRQRDPAFRVYCNVSRLIHMALKDKKAGRKWETLVGYTLADLTRHLERQFTKGMTWENMGKKGWEIDHILPRASFNFDGPDHPDFRACWALTNLRPLWSDANAAKREKRIHLV